MKYRKNIESKIPRFVKAKSRRIMLLSKCTVCGSIKWRFTKEKEASEFLNRLEIKAALIQIPIVGPILF